MLTSQKTIGHVNITRLEIYVIHLPCCLYVDATGRQEPMEFDLTIPAGDHDPTKKFRLEKKSFAIVFHTPMARKNQSSTLDVQID